MTGLLISLGLLLPAPEWDVIDADVWRFPYMTREIIARMDFADAHRKRIAQVHPYDIAWQDDAEIRYRAWSYLHDARSMYDKVGHKMSHPDGLMALHYLRQLIGDDNYLAGRMPDHVPEYRFREKP